MATPNLLASAFDFQNPGLFRGRARLLADALVLTGWHWRGRYRRHIALDRILHADVRDNGLILWLFDGETLRLRVEHPAQWKAEIEAALGQRSTEDVAAKDTSANT
ncbi:MAG TPA: hypothetical protein VKP65_23785 [Rhodothermales bacterium]|nr:hypothetical protein [Rhodothermales bacterium]